MVYEKASVSDFRTADMWAYAVVGREQNAVLVALVVVVIRESVQPADVEVEVEVTVGRH